MYPGRGPRYDRRPHRSLPLSLSAAKKDAFFPFLPASWPSGPFLLVSSQELADRRTIHPLDEGAGKNRKLSPPSQPFAGGLCPIGATFGESAALVSSIRQYNHDMAITSRRAEPPSGRGTGRKKQTTIVPWRWSEDGPPFPPSLLSSLRPSSLSV